jgi:subtilisin family serine protease/predicted nucleic acid-binding Zn ribbon protein
MNPEKSNTRAWMLILLAIGLLLLLLAAGLFLLFRPALLPTDRTGAPLSLDLADIDFTPPASLPELSEEYPQLAAVLNNPELGSVYKEFLLTYEEGGVEAARELAQERGLLAPDGESLRMTLVLDTEEHEPLVAQLETVGVEVVSAYRDRVNIAVPVLLIEGALQSDDTGNVLQELTELEHVIAVRLPEERDVDQQGVVGEGVAVIGAADWHTAGFTGEGLRIGVLDLGFAGYEELLGEELPDVISLATFGWYDEEEVHGTACAEIIHEVAPGADLVFAWYDGADASFGEAVEWLMEQDVDIISHSAGGIVSPRDGSGWDAELVDEVAAQGVLWVNSAGNEADGHYRTTYLDEDGDGYHDFAEEEALLPVEVWDYIEIYLIWNDDWDQPTRDYELLVLDEEGEVLGVSQDAQDGNPGQQPVEWVSLETAELYVYVMVEAYDDGGRPATFDIFVQGPGASLSDAVPQYSVTSPGDAVGALTVGAAEWDDDELAWYSSQGPTNDERLKPEISGPTGISGATYGRNEFDGTSASTPHIAGAAALVWEAYPSLGRQELFDFLLTASEDLGPVGPDTGYGYGRLYLPAPPEAAVIPPTPPPDSPTATPAPLITPTPVAFVTITPQPPAEPGAGEELNSEGDLNLALPFVGLVIGGFTVGGLGLLTLSGLLLIISRRPARTRTPPPRPPGPRKSAAPPRPAASPRSTPAPSRPPPRSPHASGPARPATPPPTPHPSAPPPAAGRGAPIRCASCGTAARPGARFCARCGTPLNQEEGGESCPTCGAAIKERSRFCSRCGTKL